MKKRRELEEEPTMEELTFKALLEARKAFEECINDYGCDPGYWDTKFTAYHKDVTLTERLQRFEIESELK